MGLKSHAGAAQTLNKHRHEDVKIGQSKPEMAVIKFKGRLRKRVTSGRDGEPLEERTVSLLRLSEESIRCNSGKNMTEAIEKERERFTQKMTVNGHKCSITD